MDFPINLIEKLTKAISTVESGMCKRVDVDDNIKVYAVKNVIRIDIKTSNVG